uniref:Rap associating with DIL domain n=1 Tax=Scleropages formosus TaxID=113540 RepID=A0A8C9VE91_SCLFO
MQHGCSTSGLQASKNVLGRPARTLTQVLCRTLSQKDRRLAADPLDRDATADNPAELSTQTCAPGVLRVFGDAVCTGTHYKSVLATPSSSARELVKEALLRYALGGMPAGDYVLCDVVGELEGLTGCWRPEGLRVLGDDEKPLLLQDLWRPKEGFSRRLELRRRAEVEDLIAREKDTFTAGINAQARRLQRNRAKGTTPSSWGSALGRSQSETSLETAAGGSAGGELKRTYLTLPGPQKTRQKQDNGEVRLSLYQCPHLLLLQGYSQQDCLVHLLNLDQHTVGQETASARPSICLISPDILPLHCTIRRVQPGCCQGNGPEGGLVLEPVPDAAILVNFSFVDRPTPLRHGDLLSFGAHYVFLYKNPVGTEPLPAQTLTNLRTLWLVPERERGARRACRVCGGPTQALPTTRRGFKCNSGRGQDFQRRRLHLDFEKDQEDRLVERIVSLAEPGGDDHGLAAAHLLCLVLEHCGMALEPGNFGKLLFKIATRIRCAAWVRTAAPTPESAMKSSEYAAHQFPLHLLFSLASCLQSLLFWMSNTMEVLHFLHQRCSVYLKRVEQLESNETLLSAAVLDKEEGVSVLEEVIFYTFQQSVYHITKSLYTSLMGLLDQTPGHTEGQVPESVLKVLKVFQTTQSLLQQCQVHPEVQSQMFAYLFFFSNASLFNQLLDKGPVRGWFCTSSGLQFKTNLRKVLDWTRGAGLSCPAGRFLAKLRCAVSILATPIQQLTQMSWKALRAKYPALKPAQLHYIVTQCLLGADMGPGAVWQPTTDEEVHNYRTADLLESFEDHPPIVLPTSGFQVDLESDTVDDSIYRQLLYVRHFVWSLRSKSPSTMGNTDGPVHQVHVTLHCIDNDCGSLSFSVNTVIMEAVWYSRATELCPTRASSKQPLPSHPSPLCWHAMFAVELDKGPFGLGLGLIDGLQTPLRSPGIYIRTLIPGGPASSNGRLRVGDRILAVNGTDVTGSNYQSAVDLIRWGGGKLNLLVEKKDPEVSAMIRASLC